MELEGIKRILAEHKRELEEKYKVKQIGIFGSRVRGEAKKGSDLDILVEFKEGADIDLLKFVGLENHLSDLLNLRVDLVEKSSLKPGIGQHILKEVVYV
jgi:hypothetical protein